MKSQDVAQARVVELDPQRLAVRRIEQRRLARRARLLPQRVDRRLRPRRLDAVADRALELGACDSASRLVASISSAFLYSMSAPSSWSFVSSSRARLMCSRAASASRARARS